jgi:hypothetical protein
LGKISTNLYGSYTKKKNIVLSSWKKMALPKSFQGWGLKNPFLFLKALAAKTYVEDNSRNKFVGLDTKR